MFGPRSINRHNKNIWKRPRNATIALDAYGDERARARAREREREREREKGREGGREGGKGGREEEREGDGTNSKDRTCI